MGTVSGMSTTPRSSFFTDFPATVVTGASSGIGYELARQLADAGVAVVAIGRSRERLELLAATSPRITPVAADLREVDRIPALVRSMLADNPGIGCLINNAGIQHNVRFDDTAYGTDAIADELAVNLAAPLTLTRELLPSLQSQARAWVVNVTSGLGVVPKRTAAVYSATKAGLHLFTEALRVQSDGTPLRVVEVMMPLVDTPMTQGRGRGKIAAADAATRCLDGLAAGRTEILVGRARWVPSLGRWAPGLLSSIIRNS